MNKTAFINFFKKSNIFIIGTVFIIISGIIIRTKLLLLNPSSWLDTQALALNLTRSYGDFFKPLDYLQIAPPFFMIISKFLLSIFSPENNIEYKDFILRLFPYMCGIISLPLFSILLQKMFKNYFLTMVGSFLLCFNSYAIYYSIEFKSYQSDMMFAIILMIIFYSIDIKNISIKKLSFCSLILTISPWFSGSSWLIIFTGLVFFVIKIIKERNKEYKKIAILYIPFFLNFIIFITQYYIPVHKDLYQFMEWSWDKILHCFLNFDNFAQLIPEKLNVLIPSVMHLNFWLFWGINLLLLFLKNNKTNIYFILFPIIVIIIASFNHLYPFEKRVILFLLPFFICLYIQFIWIFVKIQKQRTISVIALIISLFFINNYLKQPIDNYIIYKSGIRELFYILKEKNPELKNVITNTKIYEYQSNTTPLYEVKIPSPYMTSNFYEIINNAEAGKYYIYCPTGVPIGDKSYLKEFQKVIQETDRISNIKFYYAKAVKNIIPEQDSFIAEIEITNR